MSIYKFYHLNSDGRVIRAEIVEAQHDQAAIDMAKERNADIEVSAGGKIIATAKRAKK